LRPAFVPVEAYSRIPLFNTTINGLESFYIYSGSDSEKRANVVNTIINRQDEIEQTGNYAPMNIFPEGGTSNGTSLL